MKKNYMTPLMEIVKIQQHQLLAGSGPGAGDQLDPDKSPMLDNTGLDDSDWLPTILPTPTGLGI